METLSRTYVNSGQPSTSDSPSSELLQSSVQSLHNANPNATTKMEDFIGGMESSPKNLPKVDDVKHDKGNNKTKTWSQIRPSLDAI